MSKKTYKNLKTGNYGIEEYLSLDSEVAILTVLHNVGGEVSISTIKEKANRKDLVEVSRDDVSKALTGY